MVNGGVTVHGANGIERVGEKWCGIGGEIAFESSDFDRDRLRCGRGGISDYYRERPPRKSR